MVLHVWRAKVVVALSRRLKYDRSIVARSDRSLSILHRVGNGELHVRLCGYCRQRQKRDHRWFEGGRSIVIFDPVREQSAECRRFSSRGTLGQAGFRFQASRQDLTRTRAAPAKICRLIPYAIAYTCKQISVAPIAKVVDEIQQDFRHARPLHARFRRASKVRVPRHFC